MCLSSVCCGSIYLSNCFVEGKTDRNLHVIPLPVIINLNPANEDDYDNRTAYVHSTLA